MSRRSRCCFPAPWSIEKTQQGYVVKRFQRHSDSCVYHRDDLHSIKWETSTETRQRMRRLVSRRRSHAFQSLCERSSRRSRSAITTPHRQEMPVSRGVRRTVCALTAYSLHSDEKSQVAFRIEGGDRDLRFATADELRHHAPGAGRTPEADMAVAEGIDDIA